MKSESQRRCVMSWRHLSGALLLWAVGVTAVIAAPVDRLRAFLAGAKTLQADFSQVQIDAKGNASGKKTSGVFYLERPGKFRWNYTQPFHQEIVTSANKVWFYDADLEQVTVKQLNEAIGSTPALLLSGEIAIETNFTIEDQGTDEGMAWIRLLPKSEESGFKYVLIGLVGDDLRGMELNDNFGQVTRIYFSNVKRGLRLSPDLFKFTPPAGVDVFDEKSR
jgi:outer membrane lipoprotein carrier protein